MGLKCSLFLRCRRWRPWADWVALGVVMQALAGWAAASHALDSQAVTLPAPAEEVEVVAELEVGVGRDLFCNWDKKEYKSNPKSRNWEGFSQRAQLNRQLRKCRALLEFL